MRCRGRVYYAAVSSKVNILGNLRPVLFHSPLSHLGSRAYLHRRLGISDRLSILGYTITHIHTHVLHSVLYYISPCERSFSASSASTITTVRNRALPMFVYAASAPSNLVVWTMQRAPACTQKRRASCASVGTPAVLLNSELDLLQVQVEGWYEPAPN